METLHHVFVESQLGPLTLVASAHGLCGLEFDRRDRHASLGGHLGRWFPNHRLSEGFHPALEVARIWLKHYFAGQFGSPKDLPLDLRGTDFEQRVWNRLVDIAPGSTVTYGELAAQLGCVNGARAIGLAVGRNPVAIVVPCHRVVGSNGSLIGYGGGLDRKRWLLGHEGVLTKDLFQLSVGR
jgi:O-6-methylguanine DNA methyltransferase